MARAEQTFDGKAVGLTLLTTDGVNSSGYLLTSEGAQRGAFKCGKVGPNWKGNNPIVWSAFSRPCDSGTFAGNVQYMMKNDMNQIMHGTQARLLHKWNNCTSFWGIDESKKHGLLYSDPYTGIPVSMVFDGTTIEVKSMEPSPWWLREDRDVFTPRGCST
jgi:hypothetical protein